MPKHHNVKNCEKIIFNGIELKPLSIKLERIEFPKHCTKNVCEYCAQSFASNSDLLCHLNTRPHRGPYNCHYCSHKPIVRKNTFLHHVRSVHTGVWPFQCSHCPLKFTLEFYLNRHERKRHHILSTFSCGYCPKSYQFKESLEKHEANCRKYERPFKCQRCSMKFKSRTKLKLHGETHIESRLHKCPHCDKSFKNFNGLRRHAPIHKIPLDCEYCDKKYFVTQLLHKHVRVKHPQIVFGSGAAAIIPVKIATDLQCHECKLYFNSKQDLNQHVGSHYRYGHFPCGFCPKIFRVWDRVRPHLAQHTNERKHECDICDKRFNVYEGLRKHLMSHTGERVHSCPHCSKSFSCATTLNNHIKTHTKEKPYACSKCPWKFPIKSNLRLHELAHKKVFFCSYCTRFFKLEKVYLEHEELHVNNTGFSCDECANMFSTKGRLNVHKRIHKKLLSCGICKKKFGTNAGLSIHKKIHLNSKKLSCGQCAAQFDLKSRLQMHLHEKHNTKSNEIAVQIGSEQEINRVSAAAEPFNEDEKSTRATNMLVSCEEITKIEHCI